MTNKNVRSLVERNLTNVCSTYDSDASGVFADCAERASGASLKLPTGVFNNIFSSLSSLYSTLLFYALSFLYPAVVSSRYRPRRAHRVVYRDQEFRSADRSSTMKQYDMSRCSHRNTQDTVRILQYVFDAHESVQHIHSICERLLRFIGNIC